jgi:hypothetical protein
VLAAGAAVLVLLALLLSGLGGAAPRSTAKTPIDFKALTTTTVATTSTEPPTTLPVPSKHGKHGGGGGGGD